LCANLTPWPYIRPPGVTSYIMGRFEITSMLNNSFNNKDMKTILRPLESAY
jgi:hypothetical protein